MNELTAVEAFLAEHPEFREQHRDLAPDHRLGGQRVLLNFEELLTQSGITFVPPDETRTPQQRALSVRIEKLMEKMKPEQRDLLLRFYWEGASQSDIGKDLGISQQAVSARLQTALKAFVRLMATEPWVEVHPEDL